MKAVILAAGKATRILPLTKDTPQSLLKVGDKTILERQIYALNQCNIKDIIVVTGYLSDKIEDFSKGKKIKTFFNPFYSVSGMLMTLWIVKEELKDGFVLLYSDVLFEKIIIKQLLESKGDICLAIKKDGVREEAEKVLEENGLITKISKAELKNDGDAEFIGIVKFSTNGAKLLINEINEIARTQLNASLIDVIQALIDKGHKIHSCNINDAKWVDIDFEKDLRLANELFAK